MSLFRRLSRNRAESIDRDWPDQYSPPARAHDGFAHVERGAPMSIHNAGRILFHGSINSPNPGPPALLVAPPDVPVQQTFYARRRHGEGLFGMESLIPEGEV